MEVLVTQHEVCECYIPRNVTCNAGLPTRSPYLTCDRLLSEKALVVVTWMIGLNAFFGNMFVLVWRGQEIRTNKVNRFLLSNLAVSDLLMGIYMIIIGSADIYFGNHFPMHAENWRHGITCRIAGSLSIISSEASVFFVTLISIDRFICIRFPYSSKKLGQKSVASICTILWVVSLLLGILPSFLSGRHGVNFRFYENSHVCIGLPLALIKMHEVQTRMIDRTVILFESKTVAFDGEANGLYFSTALFLGLNFVCYLIIAVCYIEIVRSVFKSSKQAGRTKNMTEQIRLTSKVSAIVATDFCCWFPIIILGILVQAKVITLPTSVFAWCVTFVLLINSAINPYLYTISEVVTKYRRRNVEDRDTLRSSLSQNQSQMASKRALSVTKPCNSVATGDNSLGNMDTTL